jgi:hypothetical protein
MGGRRTISLKQAQVSLEFESELAVWLHFRSQTENNGTFEATDVDRALACKLGLTPFPHLALNVKELNRFMCTHRCGNLAGEDKMLSLL